MNVADPLTASDSGIASVSESNEERAAEQIDVAAAAAGDREAFARLVRGHQDRLYAVLVRTLGSPEDAADVAQDSVLLAWRKLDQFRGDSRFGTWLTRIGMNQAISFRRKRANRPHHSLTLPDGTTTTVTDPEAAPPEARMQREEDRAGRETAIRDALAKLPDDHRDVVVLKEFDGRSYAEIAEIVGCPVGTVRSRLHRARAELHTLLSPRLKELTPA